MDNIYRLITTINKANGAAFAELREDMVYFKSVDADADYFDEDEGEVNITFNIAPTDPEGEISIGDFIDQLDTEIAYMNKVKKFIIDMKPFIKGIDGDFYWGEGDLNVRVTLGFKTLN